MYKRQKKYSVKFPVDLVLASLSFDACHQILYGNLIHFLRRRTPVCFELLLAANSFWGLLKVLLNYRPIFFDWAKFWCVGRVLIFEHNLNVFSGIPLHGLFSIMAGCQIRPKQHRQVMFLQKRQQTLLKILFYVNLLVDGPGCNENVAFQATGTDSLPNEIFLGKLR